MDRLRKLSSDFQDLNERFNRSLRRLGHPRYRAIVVKPGPGAIVRHEARIAPGRWVPLDAAAVVAACRGLDGGAAPPMVQAVG